MKLWAGLAIAATVTLAACSSLSLPTAAKLRALDYLNDDIGSLLLAFDMPELLEPLPDASGFSFDISIPGKGNRHVAAILTPSDAGEIAGTLPPPGGDRTYYLFGFSEPDKARLREAQAWARDIAKTGVAPDTPVIAITPRFCRSAEIKPENVRVSVLIALPGATALEPLVQNENLAALLAATGGGDLPACAGHSG